MRYNIKDENGVVINTIVASAEFMAANYAAGSYELVIEPVAPPVVSWIIEVPAYLRRFDSMCATPKQAALACDPDPKCQGLMNLALSRVREGIDLKSTSLQGMLQMLVSIGKITQAEADKIRTTEPKQDEVFRG
jgi:hypothetical protein